MSLTTHELRSIAEEVVQRRADLRADYELDGRAAAETELCRTLRLRTRRDVRARMNVEAERVRFLAVTVAMGRELDRLVLAERAARRGDEGTSGGCAMSTSDSQRHPDIDAEVPPRRAARLAVVHLYSSYATITPAMAAAAVLGDATKARQDDLFSSGADDRFVEAVLGVADALAEQRGESAAADEPPRPVAWAVLDAQGDVRAVERSRVVASDMAEREGWHVAPLVVAAVGDVEDEGAGS